MANDFVRFARSVEYSTGKKRGRHPVFNANRFYPHALERELASLAKSELERFLSECTEAALVGIPVRDDMEELSKVPETLPESFAAGVGGVAEKMRRKASTDFAEWSEMVVGKPYYPPEAEREIFSTWTANFQTLCKSAEADAKKDISLLVSSAKNEGWNRGRLEKSIRERLPSKYRARAENIARTELGKLNSAAKLSQFREVGISYYKWLTTIDGRERDSHRSMNGLICSVSNPGVYYTENPDDPLHPVEHARTAGMFHGNPGEDFQCRCSMVAWDPEIDGMYEVRESPEGPDVETNPGTSPEFAANARLGAELEKARLEREEAETALKSAEKAKRAAERRAEILRKANERHAGRKASLVERIKNSYYVRHPVSVIKARKCETIEQVFDSIRTLDDANAQVRKRKFFRNGDLTFGGVSGIGTNGATNMQGKVFLAKDVRDGVQSAFRKIATGKSADITEDEARYIGTMWHEITHNRHLIDWNNFANNEHLPRNSRKRDAMEMMNEYVARRTLPEFYEFIGVKKTPYPKFMESRSNTGYNAWVLGLRETISFFGIDEDRFLSEAKKNLFEKAYTKQKEFTTESLVSFIPGLQKKEANRIVEACLNLYSETSVKSFKTSVLEPIKNRIDSKKI